MRNASEESKNKVDEKQPGDQAGLLCLASRGGVGTAIAPVAARAGAFTTPANGQGGVALAAELADRIAVLRGGRLMELGPIRQIIDRPQDLYTRSLIAAHIGLDSPPLFASVDMSAPANG